MRLGVSFGELITDLRAESNRSDDLGHGIGDLTRLKRALNKALLRLYDDYAWPHLRRTFARVTMAAGQRYYDLPDNLDPERVEEVRSWWNGQPTPIERGIGTSEYASYDSQADERSDPPLRYDVRYHDTPSNATMIEVWPLPASATAALEFVGTYRVSPLVNDADICLLDAEAVVLLAAVDVAPKEDRDEIRAAAAERIRQIRARFPSGAPVRMGLGQSDGQPIAGRAIVRIS